MSQNIFNGMVVGAIAALGVAIGFSINPEINTDLIEKASVQIGDYCSGTVIDDPDYSDGINFTVITAKHCLTPEQKVGSEIIVNIPEDVGNAFTKNYEIKTVIKSISNVSDLILLQADAETLVPNISPIAIYQGNNQFGDKVVSVSFPYGLTKVITDGYLGYILEVPPFSDVSEDFEFQFATTQVAGGSSGSGLFKETDYGYELIGVLTGGLGHISVYTPVEEIRVFLNGFVGETE